MTDSIKIPQNEKNENYVIDALIHSFEEVIGYCDTLKEKHFYKTRNQIVYNGIMGLYDEGKPISIPSIENHLRVNGQLEKIGGVKTLYDYEETSGMHFENNISILEEDYKKRMIFLICDEFLHNPDIQTYDKISSKLLDTIQDSEAISGNKIIPISKSVKLALSNLIDVQTHGISYGYETGYNDIDDIIGGIDNGELIILGGRPAMGKTSLALQFLTNISKKDIPALLISLEMKAEHLANRIICQWGKFDSKEVKQGTLSNSELQLYKQVSNSVSKLNIHFEDSTNSKLSNLISRIRYLVKAKGIQIVFIDYLQLISTEKNENRYAEVTQISRKLKILALNLNIPIIVLSQLNRSADGRNPTMADLRDSGSIEQDADKIILIRRPKYDGEDKFKDDTPTDGLAIIIIAKNRSVATGDVILKFIDKSTSFENKEYREDFCD